MIRKLKLPLQRTRSSVNGRQHHKIQEISDGQDESSIQSFELLSPDLRRSAETYHAEVVLVFVSTFSHTTSVYEVVAPLS